MYQINPLFVLSFVTSMIKNAHEKYGHSDWNLEEFSATHVKITTSEKHTPHLKLFSTIFQPCFNHTQPSKNHPFFGDHVLSMPHGGSQGASPRSTKCKRPTLVPDSPPPIDPSIRKFHSSPRMVIPTNPHTYIGILYNLGIYRDL